MTASSTRMERRRPSPALPSAGPETEHRFPLALRWKLHRALSRPFFAKEKISDFDCFERHASPFLKLLSDKATSQEAFDIQVRP